MGKKSNIKPKMTPEKKRDLHIELVATNIQSLKELDLYFLKPVDRYEFKARLHELYGILAPYYEDVKKRKQEANASNSEEPQ